MDKSLIAALFLFPLTALGQTHTMPGSNVVPSGANLTIQSGGTINAAAGSTVTGFTSGLVIGTNVQAWDTDLDVWATKTPYAGNVVVTTGKTFTDTNNLTLSGTDGSTLNVGGGGTLGTAAFTASTAYYPTTGGATTGNFAISAVAPTITLNPTSGLSVIDIRGTASTNDGLRLTSTASVGVYDADSHTFRDRANAVTYGTFSSTGLNLTNGITIGGAATTGKILIGNGTIYGPSTPGFPCCGSFASGRIIISDGTNWTGSTIGYPNAIGAQGKIIQAGVANFGVSTPTWPLTAGAAGYTIRSDATNFASYPAQLINSSVASQSPSTSDVYLTGSNIVVTAGDFQAKGQYKCVFDMAKSAGTGAIVITLRIGTLGTTGDPAILTFTFGAGTSVADTGLFEVVMTWRTVGAGTSAVVQGVCRGSHLLATTGLFNNAAGWVLIGSPSPSAGFNSSTATTIGLSFNGSTAFAGTSTLVQAQLQQ
jgi:hypothetical protein